MILKLLVVPLLYSRPRSGFSNLPYELGGVRGGGREGSRMGGRGME